MKILLLNLYYPPDTSATARMAAGVTEALATEHEVTILCGRPSYDPTERRPWRLWQTERSGKVEIIRVGSTDYPRTQMQRRVLNYLSYVALAVPRSLSIRCDIVLAMTDPPFEGIVGAFVALLKGKPYVYNVRDMYPDMAVAGSIVQPGVLARVWETLHRWALRRATRVIVLGEDMRRLVISKGVDPQRAAVSRDGAEIVPMEGPQLALDPAVIDKIRNGFRCILLHAGNIGFYGAWDTIIDAARGLEKDGVGVVFVGDGAQRRQVERAAAGLTNVRFLPFFPHTKIPSVLAAADAHIITIKRGLEGVVVPSKMYSILAAGRPIVVVAAKETDAAALGLQYGFAISADPDDPEQLISAIRSLAADPRRLLTMGAAARAAAPRYDKVGELGKFSQIINEARRA
jgi:colanic acid biosynthesis glycosyl transferase WcaI